MRITITEAEIKAAITNHIAAQGFNLAGKSVDIDLKATRGDAGYTADIDITNEGDEPAEISTPAPDKAPLQIAKKVSAAKATPAAKTEEADEEPPFETGDVENDNTEEADAEEAEAEESEEEAKPSARKSLFGDQKRPVNA